MNFRIKEIILLFAVLLFFNSSIAELAARWFLAGDYYSQGPLVTAAFFWLLYRSYRSCGKVTGPSYLTGSLIISLAILLDISGRFLDIRTFQYFAVYMLITGGAVFFLGRSFAAKNLMLFIYLLLAMPLPGFLLDSVTFNMKMFSSYISEVFLSVIYPSIEQYGSILYINSYYIEITPACSGMENIFGMASLLWFLALIQKSKVVAWIDVVISLPAAIVSNILRIIIVSVLTVNGYGKFALEDFHEWIGVIIFLVILFPVSLFNDISFKFTENPGDKEVEGFTRSDVKSRKLLPYIFVMSLLAVVSLVYQLNAYNRIETKYPLMKDLIAMETSGWRSADEPLDGSYYSMLGTDDILMRQYIRKGSAGEDGKVYLYFVHAVGSRAPFLHRPELCLMGEGYNLIEESEVFIKGAPARRMLFSRNGSGLIVYYWYSMNENRIGSYIKLQRHLITQLNRDYSCIMFRLSRIVDLNNVERGECVLREFAEKEIPQIFRNL